MTQQASGTFNVTLNPLSQEGEFPSRMSIDKQFQGDLEGTSQGQMISTLTETEGSAGYVAMERVSGSLGDRRGTFVLQHSGLMARGAPDLTVTVVPDSGTDALMGLSGTMQINITDGQHFYEFDYTLPDA